MTVQDVVLKALSGEIHWFRAAVILGKSARTLRCWRERYDDVGLVDKRRHAPSVRRVAPPARLEKRLIHETANGFVRLSILRENRGESRTESGGDS